MIRSVDFKDEELESKAKMKAYLKRGYNLNKETEHLNFIKKYLGFKSNDEIDERFRRLNKEGLSGLKGITVQDEINAIEKEEEKYFKEKILQNPIYDVAKALDDNPKTLNYKERMDDIQKEIEDRKI